MIGNHLEPFKFWCQKVLPNVYDDSLSYYEYLCKLNEYLNEVIGQINTLTDNMEDYESDLTAQWNDYKDALNAEWAETKNYIDNYFNNLDVQQEINNKLDNMASSGELSTLLAPVVGTQIGDVVASQIGGTVANQIGDTVASQIGDVVSQQIDAPVATATANWLSTHITPTTPVIDYSLSIQGAGADAQRVGLFLAPIYDSTASYNRGDYVLYNGLYHKANIDMAVAGEWDGTKWTRMTVSHELIDEYRCIKKLSASHNYLMGISFLDGVPDNEIYACNGIDYIEFDGDVPNVDYKIVTIINSEQFPHLIIIGTNDNNFYQLTYDANTKLNTYSASNFKITAKYNWENYDRQINISYANSKTALTPYSVVNCVYNLNKEYTSFSNIINAITNENYNKINNAKTNTPLSVYGTLDEKYIADNGSIGNYTLSEIRLYAVEKGKSYRIYGVSYLLAFPCVGFTYSSQPNKFIIVYPKKEVNDYYNTDFIYNATDNGYIGIVEIKANTKHLSICEYLPNANVEYASFGNDFKNSFNAMPNVEKTGETENKKYINTNGSISTIENEVFNVCWYEIKKGETVVLNGKARLAGTSYPIAGFGERKYYVDEVIIDGTYGDRLTEYNVKYEATKNGFIAIAYMTNSGYGRIKCYTPSFVNIGNTYGKTLKIQAFGDSITDDANNTWSGHTTWLGQIENVMSNYNLSVVNSAYGGAALSDQNQYSIVNRVCGNSDRSVESLLDETADVIVVWGGTNDWAGSLAQIGNLQSDDTTIVGATKKIIEYISNNTSALLIFATPMQRYNSVDAERPVNTDGEPLNTNSNTLKEVSNAIENTCKFYGIKCINFNNDLGINRINVSDFTSDGLHPNTVSANRRIASMIGSTINEFKL